MDTEYQINTRSTVTYSYLVDISGYNMLHVLTVLELELPKILHSREVIDHITCLLRIKSVIGAEDLQENIKQLCHTENSNRVGSLIAAFENKPQSALEAFLNIIANLELEPTASEIQNTLKKRLPGSICQVPNLCLLSPQPITSNACNVNVVQNAISKTEPQQNDLNSRVDLISNLQVPEKLHVSDEIFREVQRRKLLSDSELAGLLTSQAPERKFYKRFSCSVNGSVGDQNNGSDQSVSPMEALLSRNNEDIRQNSSSYSQIAKTCGPSEHRGYSQCSDITYWIRKRYLYIVGAVVFFGTAVAILALVGVLISFFVGPVAIISVQSTCLEDDVVETSSIKSLDDYNYVVGSIGDKQNITSVTVNILDSTDWPVGVHIEISKSITDLHLKGKMHATKMVELMGSVPNLKHIAIDNKCNKLCSETSHLQARMVRDIIRHGSQRLILKDFQHGCEKVFYTLKQQVQLHSLNEVIIKGGEMNIALLNHLDNLLADSGKTFSKLEIQNVTIREGIFNKLHGQVFPNVKTVTFNPNSVATAEDFSKLCHKYPNIEHFSSSQPLEIEKLEGCLQLKSLKITINTSATGSSFDLGYVAKTFTRLESLSMSFVIPHCRLAESKVAVARFYILGRNSLPELLAANTRISSNCRLTVV